MEPNTRLRIFALVLLSSSLCQRAATDVLNSAVADDLVTNADQPSKAVDTCESTKVRNSI